MSAMACILDSGSFWKTKYCGGQESGILLNMSCVALSGQHSMHNL